MQEQGTGPAVLVLHRSTGPFWTPLHENLSGVARVVAPDMPGYGQSARPETARSPRDLAILLLQLLDARGDERVHVVGLGFGGWVAAEMLRAR